MKVQTFREDQRWLISSWGYVPPEGLYDPKLAFVIYLDDVPSAFGCLIDTSASFVFAEYFLTDPTASRFRRARAFYELAHHCLNTAKSLKKRFMIGIVPAENSTVLKFYKRYLEPDDVREGMILTRRV